MAISELIYKNVAHPLGRTVSKLASEVSEKAQLLSREQDKVSLRERLDFYKEQQRLKRLRSLAREHRMVRSRPDSSMTPKRSEFFRDSVALLDKVSKHARFPEIRDMGKTLTRLYDLGDVGHSPRLDGTETYLTFRGKVNISDDLLKASEGTGGRLTFLALNAGLLAHEATHSHYGVTDEKPGAGKLSPPRVGLEALRTIRDFYQASGDSSALKSVDAAIKMYIAGAKQDGFTAEELAPRIIKQASRRD